ncbi:hypothetical protein A9Q84_10355 [Halobacteriovorax marinus]|uniref:Uncharacterized protein n=1 Tax=Halobacteriovorax marinus TaxID=97084 RepID=A0A1Y5F759_9BACT|nr:hypothetical protein A9Q84_10355 [Halobacteriovorax marinus]
MNFKYLFHFILLSLLVMPQAFSLPNFSGKDEDRDIQFNIFKLGGGLIDSSVMRFSKCAGGNTSGTLSDLVDNTTQLDCNNHTQIKPFCRCVNLVAGGKVDRKGIKKKLEKQYFDYLKNHEQVKKDFLEEKLFEEYVQLTSLMEDKSSCAPELAEKFDEMREIYSQQQAGSPKVPNHFVNGTSLANQVGWFDVDGMGPVAHSPDMKIYKKAESNSGIDNFEEVSLFLKSIISKYPTMDQMDLDTVDYIIKEEFSLHGGDLICTDSYHTAIYRHTIIGAIIEKGAVEEFSDARNSNLLGSIAYPSEVRSIGEHIKNELQNNINLDCSELNKKFLRFQDSKASSNEASSKSFDDYVHSTVMIDAYKGDGIYSFNNFVKEFIVSNDLIDFANQRFEADIYFCHKNNLDDLSERIIADKIKNEEKFAKLQELLKRDTELTNDIFDMESELDRVEVRIRGEEESREQLQEEILSLRAENKDIKDKVDSGTLTHEQLSSANKRFGENKGKIRENIRQIRIDTSSITRNKNNAKTLRTDLGGLVAGRVAVGKSMTDILDGDSNATNLMVQKSRQAIFGKPKIVTYDLNTKRYTANSNFAKEHKKFNENPFAALDDIKGYKAAEEKLAKTGKNTLSNFFKAAPKVSTPKFKISSNPFNINKVSKVSKKIQDTPSDKLSSQEKNIQKKLSALDAYEKRIDAKVQNFQKVNSTVKSSPKISKQDESITSLKEEIKNVKRDREEFSRKIKAIQNKSTNKTSTTVVEKSPKDEDSSRDALGIIKSGDFRKPSAKGTSVANKVADNVLADFKSLAPVVAGNQDIGKSTTLISGNNTTRLEGLASPSKENFSLDDSNVFNDTVLSENDFSELSGSLDPQLLDKYSIKEGEYISVDNSSGRIIYNPIFKNGKVVRFEKVKVLSKEEVLIAHKKEKEKIQRMKYDIVKHADLVNLFSGILRR